MSHSCVMLLWRPLVSSSSCWWKLSRYTLRSMHRTTFAHLFQLLLASCSEVRTSFCMYVCVCVSPRFFDDSPNRVDTFINQLRGIIELIAFVAPVIERCCCCCCRCHRHFCHCQSVIKLNACCMYSRIVPLSPPHNVSCFNFFIFSSLSTSLMVFYFRYR